VGLTQLRQRTLKRTKKFPLSWTLTTNGSTTLSSDLSVSKKTQVIISLMQEDEKTSNKQYIPVNFIVVRTKSKKDRLWEVEKNDIVLEAAEGL